MPDDFSISNFTPLIRSGRLRPVDLLQRCLETIRQYDPQVHAWVSVDEAGARTAAERLEAELQRGQYRGPLHGIPIGIKDIIDVAGWPTLAGSPLRAGHVAQADAPLVARLRESGAIILGKTVTTEFAGFDPSATRNPWNLAHTPGGSSSGSAAAVALGMCLAAIGSQTGGSITRPASYCGVAGCKPTWGRVSVSGVLPVSFHLDHPGPMAPTVADLAIMLAAIAGYEPSDPCCLDEPCDDYPAHVETAAEKATAPRLGLLDGFFEEQSDEPVRQLTRAAIEKLRSHGAEIVAASLPASFASVHRCHRTIMAVEAAAQHRPTFPEQRSAYGPRLAAMLDEGRATPSLDYAAALAQQRQFRRDMVNLLEALKLETFVTPATNTTAPPRLDTTGDPRFNSPWSHAGLPTVSFPCGLTSSSPPMPGALQLVGRPFGEGPLLAAAAWCQRAVNFSARPPLLVETS